MKEKITVVLIDNSPIFRTGLRLGFAEVEDIEIVGDSNIDAEVLELVKSLCPEIALLDIGLPQLTGLTLAQQIARCSPEVSIFIMVSHDNDEYLFQAIKSGAVGYLSKNITIDELASALRRAHDGERLIDETVLSRPKVAESVLKQFRDLSMVGASVAPMTAPLTPRELEVLKYVACGYVNKQVAFELGISEQTIKNHMSSILHKLDANDRTQAVVMAMRNGWISSRVGEPPEPAKQSGEERSVPLVENLMLYETSKIYAH